MSISRRTITIEPDEVTVSNGDLMWNVPNTKHVQEKAEMAFAYRVKNDHRIRAVIVDKDYNGADELGILLVDEYDPISRRMVSPKLTPPHPLENVGYLTFSVNHKFLRKLTTEYAVGNLVEGNTFLLGKREITLLTTAEADDLSKCLFMVGANNGDSGESF